VQANPEGAFVTEANARISELDFARRNAAALQAAERNEQRLGLNDGTRRLVEDRLMRLGLQPGPVDGVFDDKTRRAIRRYQDARRLQKTGYLNQATVVRLLADSVLR
jgi:peptidoglycan hydrolase-like protein with peptidoglycan-binding domain